MPEHRRPARAAIRTRRRWRQAPPTFTALAALLAATAAPAQIAGLAVVPGPNGTAGAPTRAVDATLLDADPGTVVRLRDPAGEAKASESTKAPESAPSTDKPRAPSEFESFVEQTIGHRLPRFGDSLLAAGSRDFTPSPTSTVPPDYTLNPGDTLVVGLTGSLEGNLQLTIDNDGRVFVPHIGPVTLAGVRYGDVGALLSRRLGVQFRDFKVSVAVGRLRGVRVYVTGYAERPGAYTVSSLSTLVNAVLAAGGPGPGGSFRSIILRRNGRVVTEFDLYDLLLNGDKSRDAALQNEDVLYISPAGPQVAIAGSVNAEAIYEARQGETLADVLRFAGGANSVADTSRVLVARLANIDKMGWEELSASAAARTPADRGTIVRVLTPTRIARPVARQAVVVTMEGEVQRPGLYYLAPGATLGDLVTQAGGLTPQAFVFGTRVDRASVRQQQQAGFDRAVANMELALAASPLLSRRNAEPTRLQAARQTLAEIKSRQPDGRLILQLTPTSRSLPSDLVLENNDRIFVPPTPRAVGVFGAVYEPGSFAYSPERRLGDYLKTAGGVDRIGDDSDVFVVRANGAVMSMRGRGRGRFLSDGALPGDVLFVPVDHNRGELTDRLAQFGALVYQFSLGAAALKVLGQ